jgi:hypothetical protein
LSFFFLFVVFSFNKLQRPFSFVNYFTSEGGKPTYPKYDEGIAKSKKETTPMQRYCVRVPSHKDAKRTKKLMQTHAIITAKRIIMQ